MSATTSVAQVLNDVNNFNDLPTSPYLFRLHHNLLITASECSKNINSLTSGLNAQDKKIQACQAAQLQLQGTLTAQEQKIKENEAARELLTKTTVKISDNAAQNSTKLS